MMIMIIVIMILMMIMNDIIEYYENGNDEIN